MDFINRTREMQRLQGVTDSGGASFVVIWGRRRLGKSRLLTEWSRKVGGAYWVADESSSAIQRKYLASELESVIAGFGAVTYPDWNALLDRLSQDARHKGWRGPLIIDEFPYLVSVSPELPSVLQKWVDREKREDGITLVLSGSSQRMMTESILKPDAPLYGRADEMFRVEPLLPGHISRVIGASESQAVLDFYTCWGGVPRYWELAQPFQRRHRESLDQLVLSPDGVLHDEVNRLLQLDIPSATPLRPILDAIGLGAHRVSEVAGRLQTPVTSLSRGFRQLQELGYVRREVPFGENEKRSKKALYRLSDPFLRLWFKVVAPHRGTLQTGPQPVRMQLLDRVWSGLRAEAWEEVCRLGLPHLGLFNRVWQPPSRYWETNGSEWDLVSASMDDDLTILGECKSLNRPANKRDIENIIRSVTSKTIPPATNRAGRSYEFVIFVPQVAEPLATLPARFTVVDGQQVFGALSGD